MLRLDSQEAQHLAKSILLEESGNPIIARVIIWFTVLVVASFTVWAALTPVDEAANAEGEIVPVGQVKQVQHLVGGTIAEILVGEGDQVVPGQVVMRLDTRVSASQIKELEIQAAALQRQKELLTEELDMRQKLFKQGLESKLSMLSLSRTMEAIEIDISRTNDQLKRAQFTLDNTEVRVTESGIVHGLNEHTIGGVVAPGSTILEVVPQQQELIAEIRILPAHIGHIKTGQSVKLKFDAYDFSRYGMLEGTLEAISATTFLDDGGKPYYKGRVKAGHGYLDYGGSQLPLYPGMTLTASIRTGEKTVLEYILKPIYASTQKVLRER